MVLLAWQVEVQLLSSVAPGVAVLAVVAVRLQRCPLPLVAAVVVAGVLQRQLCRLLVA